MKRTNLRHLAVLLAILLMATGCSSPSRSPIDAIRSQIVGDIDYSIILEDMKQEGVFAKESFHKYRIVTPEGGTVTDWYTVSPSFYEDNRDNLGMTLHSRVKGEEQDTVAPPGYAYVGNPQYGQWRQRSDGSSFWEFYGKYALLRSLFGGWYSPIGFRDYGYYRDHRQTRRPYYGTSTRYGTNSGRSHNRTYRGNSGSSTRSAFGQKVDRKQTAGKSSFASKVKKRVGRTRVTSRSRGGGFGK